MLANPFDLLGLDADADESDSDEELVFAQGQHIRESMDDQRRQRRSQTRGAE
jgi:hypothetical protein